MTPRPVAPSCPSPGGGEAAAPQPVACSGLTAVVPCFNESGQVAAAHRAIVSALGGIADLEILFIDDGSTDDTLEHLRAIAARDRRVRFISFSRNFGLSAAVTAGFRYASRPWIVQLDADLQFPPGQTWSLLAEAAKGYDVVFGVRRIRHDPVLRRMGAFAAQWAARRLLGIEVPMGASSFRVLRAPVARILAELRMTNAYFAAKVPLVTSRYTVVETTHQNRAAGRSRFRPLRLVGHAFELFFGFSWRPLNAVYLMAAVTACVAALVTAAWLLGAVAQAGVALAALLSSALGTVACALSARYLHRFMLDGTPLRPYYVAESNLDVRAEDTLDGGVAAVPPPARPDEREKERDHGE